MVSVEVKDERPKDINELKGWLARKLRMKVHAKRFGVLWATLEQEPYVEEWEMGAINDEQFLEKAEEFRNRFRAWEERHYERRTKQDIPVEPTKRERAATDAFRAYLAAHAAGQPLVQRFRREFLPQSRLLTRDDLIEAFLTVTLDVELDLELYLDSHRVKSSNLLPFQLNGQSPAEESRVFTKFTNEDVAQMIAKEQSKQERRLEDRWEDPDAMWMQSFVEDGSSEVGRLLEELGEWLADVYPWSHVGDAVVFVISGRPPRLAEPLSVAINMGHATYSITFSPWVSKKTVMRAYRTAISRHRQLPGDKTIRVLRFVSEQADEEGHLPSWSELERRWNRANPAERFWDKSHLHSTYSRAVEALVPPYLPLT